MTTVIKSSFSTPHSLPTFDATAAEEAIMGIASLKGWFEADQGVQSSSGFRWRDRLSARHAALLNTVSPLLVTGSHGLPALQFSYGSASFSGTERGALRPPSQNDLIATTGFTVFSVTRIPTVASSEAPVSGGQIWSSRGSAATTTPGLLISASTGRPAFRAGGAQIVNPSAFDARTGNWHVMRCAYDAGAATISLNIDRTRASANATGASTPPDSTVANMLAPLVGGFLNSSGAFSLPLYGQLSAILFFATPLSAPDIATVENYLAAKYGLTLV